MPLTGPNSFFRQRNAITDPNNGISDEQRASLLLQLAQQQDADAERRGVAAAGGGGARFRAQNILNKQPGSLSYRNLSQREILDEQTVRQTHASNLRTRQRMAEKQWGKLVDAAADPNNPMTQQELELASEQFQNQHGGLLAGAVNPIQLRKRNEEVDDPQLDVVNTSKAWADQFGLPQEQVTSFFGQPANGKFYTQAEKKSAFDMARQAADQDPSSGKVSAVTRQLTRLDKQIETFQENSSIFENGSLKPRPTVGSFFATDAQDRAAIAAYDAEKERYDRLIAQQVQYEEQLQRYASGDPSGAIALPETPQTPAPPAGVQTAPTPEPAGPGASPETPVELPDNATEEEQAKVIEAARRRSAAEDNRVVYVRFNGSIYPIQAGQ